MEPALDANTCTELGTKVVLAWLDLGPLLMESYEPLPFANKSAKVR